MKRSALIFLIIFILLIIGGIILSFGLRNKGGERTEKTKGPISIKQAEFIQVIIEDNGFNPVEEKLKIKNDGIIEFVNKTSKPVKIVSKEPKINIIPKIEPGKSIRSLPLTQGEYEFTLEGTENLKGKVVFTK